MDTKKPAIIVDIGGVLLDWDPRYLYRKIFHGEEAQVEDFLARICTLDWNLRIDEGQPFLEAVAELSARHPEYADQIRAYHDRWEEMLIGPIHDNVELLEALAKAGYPLYALTNFSTEKFLFTRARYGFFRLFRDIVVSAEVRMAKPDPRIFELLLRRIGRRAPECIYVDDTALNVKVAQRLGFHAILAKNPGQLRVDLASLGVSVNNKQP